MTDFQILKRLYNDYTKKHLKKIILALLLSVAVAASTSSIAYLLDPAIKEIFIKKDQTMILIIPILIVIAFATKGLSLYIAKTTNDDLTIKEIMTGIDNSTEYNANKLFSSTKEKLFRLNLVNYCCIKFLKYNQDTALINHMEVEILNGWENMTFTKIEESCNDRQHVLSKKC